MFFDVIDTQTGQYPDLEKIALNEEWADHLVYCDMDGFAITEAGCLILMDECGNIAYPPEGRFSVAAIDLNLCPTPDRPPVSAPASTPGKSLR